MIKYTLLLLCCIGCESAPNSAPISEATPTHAPVPPAGKPGFYQGYAVISKWNPATQKFQRAGTDSAAAQIRVITADDELHATVTINNGDRPLDVFLFTHGGYYLGNDSTSYAYFSGDNNGVVWGCPSASDPNLYKTIYASR